MLGLSACMMPGSPGFYFCSFDKWGIESVRRLRWSPLCQGFEGPHVGDCSVVRLLPVWISAQTWTDCVLPSCPTVARRKADETCHWAPGCPAGWREKRGSAWSWQPYPAKRLLPSKIRWNIAVSLAVYAEFELLLKQKFRLAQPAKVCFGTTWSRDLSYAVNRSICLKIPGPWPGAFLDWMVVIKAESASVTANMSCSIAAERQQLSEEKGCLWK